MLHTGQQRKFWQEYRHQREDPWAAAWLSIDQDMCARTEDSTLRFDHRPIESSTSLKACLS